MIVKTKEDAECFTPSEPQKQFNIPKKQSIKYWEAKTILILGRGLFLLIAFNYFTCFLPKVLGTSGTFWQTQWENLHHTLGGNEWLIFTLGTVMVPGIVFWSISAVFLMADITGKPTFITQYCIQLGKNDPVDRTKLRESIFLVLFNQIFISVPMLMLTLPILKWRGDPLSLSLPTLPWFLFEMAVCAVVSEVLFYYIHRFNECYGVLSFMDYLHRTDTTFRQSKAQGNISESIPELPKKSD